jgi:rod shape-determining protein MreC
MAYLQDVKKHVLYVLLVLLLLVGFPTGLWIAERALPAKADAARSGLQTVLSPVVRAAAWSSRHFSNALEYLVTTKQVRRLNKALKSETDRLQAENEVLREALSKYDRLDVSATLAEMNAWRSIPADVVAYGHRPRVRSIEINRGNVAGVRAGAPVLHLRSLAGVVTRVGRWTATVQLLTDPQTNVGVVIAPSRVRGVARGTADADVIEVLPENPDIVFQPGQKVVTSGMEGSLYPRGLVVGVITGTRHDRFDRVVGLVRPQARLERMDEVLVLALDRESSEGSLDLSVESTTSTQTVPLALPAQVQSEPTTATATGEE